MTYAAYDFQLMTVVSRNMTSGGTLILKANEMCQPFNAAFIWTILPSGEATEFNCKDIQRPE